MNVIDEEWEADERGYLRVKGGDCIFIGDSMGDGASTRPERATLAAQAPAMARLLRALLKYDGDHRSAGAAESVLRAAGVLP